MRAFGQFSSAFKGNNEATVLCFCYMVVQEREILINLILARISWNWGKINVVVVAKQSSKCNERPK